MEVFLFCHKPYGFRCRAIYVPIHLLDNKSKFEIEKMLEYGEILNEIDYQNGGGTYTNKFHDIRNILHKWEMIADDSPAYLIIMYDIDNNRDLHEEFKKKIPKYHYEVLGYYQKDFRMDPLNTYKILKEKTNYKNKEIKVVKSIYYMN